MPIEDVPLSNTSNDNFWTLVSGKFTSRPSELRIAACVFSCFPGRTGGRGARAMRAGCWRAAAAQWLREKLEIGASTSPHA